MTPLPIFAKILIEILIKKNWNCFSVASKDLKNEEI